VITALLSCVMCPGETIAAQLEEVVITATKRTESIQETAMSIQVVMGKAIQQRGITNLDQLSATIPGFQVGDGLLTTNVALRGMGSQPESGFEQSVGMFIDGVYMPRSRQYRAPFMDTARVEILRGPQAVLFGLNSTAGAVSVISNSSNPGDEFTAEIMAAYEFEYEGVTMQGHVGGSVGDTVGLRLAGKYRKDEQGYYDNVFKGGDENAPEEEVLRATIVLQPVDTTRIQLKVDWAHFEFDGDLGEEYQTPYVLDSIGISNGNSERKLNFTRNMDAAGGEFLQPKLDGRNEAGMDQDAINLTFTVDQDFSGHSLSAIIGYSDLEWNSLFDIDFGPNLLLTGGIHEDYDQSSLEVRWTSPKGEKLEWIVGGFYMDSALKNTQPNVLGSAYTDPIAAAYGLDAQGYNFAGDLVTPVVFLDGDMDTDTESVSLFAFGTLHLTEDLRLSAGVRWVDTEIDYRRADSPCTTIDSSIMPQPLVDALASDLFCFNARGYKDDRSSSHIMPELSVDWDVSDEIMLYGKVSESAKNGGYSLSTILVVAPDGSPLAEYDDETARGYELGMKGSFGSWELNGTLFRTEFDDLQVNTFDPVTAASYIQNAAEAVSQGLELEGRWLANNYLTLGAAYTYLDAEYDDFNPAPCAVDGSVPVSKQFPQVCDASGRSTPYAPEHGATLSADVTAPMGDWLNFLGGVYLSYSDEYYTDSSLADFLKQDSYVQVDARIGVEATDSHWTVALIGSNLTDEKILNNSQVFLANSAYLKSPRTYLLQGTYRF
jgi:iron complex outermembrane receptor protein